MGEAKLEVKPPIPRLAKRLVKSAWGNCACTPACGRVGTSALKLEGFPRARVAELVDAHDSGSCPSNGVQVQLLPRAPSVLAFSNRHFRQLVYQNKYVSPLRFGAVNRNLIRAESRVNTQLATTSSTCSPGGNEGSYQGDTFLQLRDGPNCLCSRQSTTACNGF